MVTLAKRGCLAIAMVAAAVVPSCGDNASLDPVDAAISPADGASSDGASSDGSVPVECTVEVPTSCPDSKPHYNDVRPIFENRCVMCHSGANEEWPLTSYEHAADWYDLIPPEIAGCTMPPPEENVPITDEERELILTWYLCGFPK